MNPTKEQLADPKWWGEHAPEGATHWEPSGFSIPSWMKFDGEAWAYWPTMDPAPFWVRSAVSTTRIACMIPRPTAAPTERPQWNGEDLPPVGVECEAYWPDDDHPEWYKLTFLFIGEEHTVLRFADRDGEHHYTRSSFTQKRTQFRPVRTPEQIAAEEREKAIADMVRSSGFTEPYARSICESLYIAGYRLVEGGEK